ncbi:hypothetical protein [Rhizobacter sp. Root1221]|uniref:hypothetical protein n=1 Tax=Rhizobacter sp. Root1221 TaxID=1736433 RepID=UPI001F41CA50|nr:hypothetical protein [Rhizobacter sp. Root1221]
MGIFPQPPKLEKKPRTQRACSLWTVVADVSRIALCSGALGLTSGVMTVHAAETWPSKANQSTLARPIDKSMDISVGCASGGDLYFEIGEHLVRVDPDRWLVSPRALLSRAPSQSIPRQACKTAPLRVAALQLAGPMDRKPEQMRNLRLFDIAATPDHMLDMRDDFRPHESTCRRGAHWTYCSAEISMSLATPRNEGIDAFVSLKVDSDFYRTPVGGVFFVPSGGSIVMQGNFIVFYRWDKSLALASVGEPCTRPPYGQVPVCNPSILIEGDRDIRQLVRGLLDPEMTPAPKAEKPATASPTNNR